MKKNHEYPRSVKTESLPPTDSLIFILFYQGKWILWLFLHRQRINELKIVLSIGRLGSTSVSPGVFHTILCGKVKLSGVSSPCRILHTRTHQCFLQALTLFLFWCAISLNNSIVFIFSRYERHRFKVSISYSTPHRQPIYK